MSFSSLSHTILFRNGGLLSSHPSPIPTSTGALTRSTLTTGWDVLLSELTRNLWSDIPDPPSQHEAILHRTICLWAASREVQKLYGKNVPACQPVQTEDTVSFQLRQGHKLMAAYSPPPA